MRARAQLARENQPLLENAWFSLWGEGSKHPCEPAPPKGEKGGGPGSAAARRPLRGSERRGPVSGGPGGPGLPTRGPRSGVTLQAGRRRLGRMGGLSLAPVWFGVTQGAPRQKARGSAFPRGQAPVLSTGTRRRPMNCAREVQPPAPGREAEAWDSTPGCPPCVGPLWPL